MKFTGMSGHHSARPTTETWLTPPSILSALGEFDLDPCASLDRPWDTAKKHFTIEDNGLLQRWDGRVWLNPPYTASTIGKWLGRMAEHNFGTALIFARTETAAFHRHVWESCSGLLFLEGRLNFHHADGSQARANAGAPSVLCAYGNDDFERLAECGIAGSLVVLRVPRLFALATILPTWAKLVYEFVSRQEGPVALADLYQLMKDHPKTKGRQHWQAKVRQVLQQGPFERVGRGEWRLA